MVFTTWLTAGALNGASLEKQHHSLSSTVLSEYIVLLVNIRSACPICRLPVHSIDFICFPVSIT